MAWATTDTEALQTELDLLEAFVNECDDKIRTARPAVKGLRAVIANVGLDGAEIPDDDRQTLKTNLIALSKKCRGVT